MRDVLLIDNLDSFSENVAQLFATQEARVTVHRADQPFDLTTLRTHSHIVISPGPGHPKDATLSRAVLAQLQQTHSSTPVLGICLGHQVIGLELGAEVGRAKHVRHGKTSTISLRAASPLFEGLPVTFQVMRYHSWVIRTPGSSVAVIADSSDDGEIMAVQATKQPWFGVQFHPESFLSEYGADIARNFLNHA